MDRPRTLSQGLSVAVGADGLDFGDDRQGDLFGVIGSEIETDRRIKVFFAAGAVRGSEQAGGAAARAKHADVGAILFYQLG